MEVNLYSTTKIVELKTKEGAIIPARVWEGTTKNGIHVHAYVTRIAHDENEPPAVVQQFKEELAECRKPSPEIQAIPMRLVL